MYEELFVRLYYTVYDQNVRTGHVDHLRTECVRHPASGWWDIQRENLDDRFWVSVCLYDVID